MPSISKSTISHVEAVADKLGIPSHDAWCLRRAAMTLRRWYTAECGDSNANCSWCIERNEKSGKPYKRVSPHHGGQALLFPIRDMEAGATKRIAAICKQHGLHIYLQTDPRGGTLYLDRKPIPADSYSNAIFLA